MTTIAYRDGVMACDSCWTVNGSDIDTLSSKIVRLKSGALLGQSGDNDARALARLLDKVKSKKTLPSYDAVAALRVDGLFLLVLLNGDIFKVGTTRSSIEQASKADEIGCWRVERPFTAIGSGSAFATGAMTHGADAEEAVRIACEHDINSRPPIHTVRLK